MWWFGVRHRATNCSTFSEVSANCRTVSCGLPTDAFSAASVKSSHIAALQHEAWCITVNRCLSVTQALFVEPVPGSAGTEDFEVLGKLGKVWNVGMISMRQRCRLI